MGVYPSFLVILCEYLPIVHVMSLAPLGQDVEKGFGNDVPMHPKPL